MLLKVFYKYPLKTHTEFFFKASSLRPQIRSRESETLSIPPPQAPVRGQEVGKVGKDQWASG